MNYGRSWPLGGILLIGLNLGRVILAAEGEGPKRVDFNRDVRPILSENCFFCHGPDKAHREAGLRLDIKDGLRLTHDDVQIVVPGKPDESELFLRITSDDPNERMPSKGSGKALTEKQVATLKAWIEQGAEYQGHWSLLPPSRPEVPRNDEPEFTNNTVDRLILAKLHEAALKPSAEADRVTLLRRLSFDLTGLPPTRDEISAFVDDTSSNAYEKQVDRLLASPRFGERMAQYWLDLVRFADTIGYHSDNPRNIWPYRDYVINAFNQNMPFDRFTIEQLAGDLLPDSTVEQRVASGYNRLLQTTEEGGAQAAEYEAKYAADRVRNVSGVWLGATMGCAQCHDHKFDPFTTREFYGFAAFFADVTEAAVGSREPGMLVPKPQEALNLASLDDAITRSKARVATLKTERSVAQTEWERGLAGEKDWKVLEVGKAVLADGSSLLKEADGIVKAPGHSASNDTFTLTVATGPMTVTAFRLEVLDDPGLPASGPGASANGNFVLTEFKIHAPQPIKIVRALADFSQDRQEIAHAIDGQGTTGWAILPQIGKSHEAVFELETPIAPATGVATVVLEFHSPYAKHHIGKFRLSATSTSDPLKRWTSPALRLALATPLEKRDEAQKKAITAHFEQVALSPTLKDAEKELADLERRKAEILAKLPRTLVTVAGTPRTTRVLPRGNWLDQSGEVVEPHVPRSLGQVETPGRRPTRLDLARWIVSRDNTLTARVTVNRFWKLAFGQGLVRSLEDFGSQGDWPSHHELLDWLAVEFMEHGWNVKYMMRLLVTSGTYRQSSLAPSVLREADPFNRHYARQSRFRLDAEAVRDNALTISGLLCREIGGPSVKPYQPAGYWDALNFPTRTWQESSGQDQYRRGLYTHWQRSFLHPSLQAFDATTREECVAERSRSNIPQQALVLLNDPTYIEAARVFATRILAEGGKSSRDRITWAFEAATSRKPKDRETAVLVGIVEKHAEYYRNDPEAARKLIKIGQTPAPEGSDTAELASWTSAARVLLNLQETITRD